MRVEAGDSHALGRRRGARGTSVRPRHALCLCALLLLMISACSTKTMDVETIRAAFERAGLEVGQPEPNTEPEDVTFFAGSSELFRVRPNGLLVDLFRFPSPEDASRAAAKVSDEGYTVPIGSGAGVAMVQWAGRPHFFVRGRLIALYVSGEDASAATTDERVLQTLRAEMGQEFAGGSSEYVQQPTAGLRIVITKSERRLDLHTADGVVRTYRVGLGSDALGDKEREGDGRTPEGEFYVCVKNPESKFYRSLGLSYPNRLDAERGLREGLISDDESDRIVEAIDNGKTPPQDTPLGGEIYIHGGGAQSDWTAGCIALDNENMQDLYDAVDIGTPVTIKP